MKSKLFKLVSFLFVLMLFFTGCSNNAGKETIIYEKEIIREVPVTGKTDTSDESQDDKTDETKPGESNNIWNTNIGKIYYSDGTYSRNYDDEKNPVGIVCNIDSEGRPSVIIALVEPEFKKTRSEITSYVKDYGLSYDGFGAGTWYQPTVKDMYIVYTYENYIIAGITTLIENGYKGNIYNLRMGDYRTNSKMSNMTGDYYYFVNLKTGEVSGDSYSGHVRLMHKINY